MSQFRISDPEISSPMGKLEYNLYDHTELVITDGKIDVYIVPEIGGMVTRINKKTAVGVVDVLHFSEAAFNTANPKPKMGIPMLLPFGGPSSMRQHGWLREVPWIWEDSTDSSITLSLATRWIQDEKLLMELREKFGSDLDFLYTLTISVSEGIIQYDISVQNQSDFPMPIAPGLHPYFRVDSDNQKSILSNLEWFSITSALWKEKKAKKFARNNLEDVWFDIPGIGKITMECDREFDTFIIWSQWDEQWVPEPYICIEPWVGGVGAIDDPERRIEVPGKQAKNLTVRFKIESPE